MRLKAKLKFNVSPRTVTKDMAFLATEGTAVYTLNGALAFLKKNYSTKSQRPPGFGTGKLEESLDYELQGPYKAIVATDVEYSVWVEYGTYPHEIPTGGSTEQLRRGYPLSWVDEQTGERRFAWSVNHPGGVAKPFMRPAALNASRSSAEIARQVETTLERRYG